MCFAAFSPRRTDIFIVFHFETTFPRWRSVEKRTIPEHLARIFLGFILPVQMLVPLLWGDHWYFLIILSSINPKIFCRSEYEY